MLTQVQLELIQFFKSIIDFVKQSTNRSKTLINQINLKLISYLCGVVIESK